MAHNYSEISSTATVDFSDAEIRSELSRLGYNDIDDDQFEEFKKDLLTLVQSDRSNSFSSQHFKSKTPHHYSPTDAATRNRFDNLYEPPLFHEPPLRGKENVDSISRLPSSTFGRMPLGSAKANTIYRTPADTSYPGKGAGDFQRDASKSLPIKTTSHYHYHSPDEYLSERLQATGDLRRSDVHRLYDEPSDNKVGHLDDIWYADRHSREMYIHSPAHRDDSTSPEASQTDHRLIESFNNGLNLSQASQTSLVKRKVSRKLGDGTSEVYEQSYLKADSDTETESVASEDVNDRLGSQYADDGSSERVMSRQATRPPSARYDKSIDPVKSAVIWPEPKAIASRNVMKTDPVNRFQQYQQEWNKTKVPEEKKHKNLRWAVREQMLYRDIIYEKRQKTFVTNKYVVPTDKKRKDLRWRIRADMAAGMLPNPH